MLEIKIDYTSAQPLYQQIVQQIEKLIISGQLVLGEQIPSVRDLAGWLQINPSTVARAYFDLKRQGLVSTSRRRGTVITNSGQIAHERQSLNAASFANPDPGLFQEIMRNSSMRNLETAFTLHPSLWHIQRST